MLVLLWNLFEQSVNIYDAVIIMYFICESFGHDLHSRRNRTTYFVGVIIMASIITILNNITIYEGLLGLVYSVYFFSYMSKRYFNKKTVYFYSDKCYFN